MSSEPGADETYAPGDVIRVTVTFDQAVTVTGTPRIQLRVGGGDPEHLKWADYTSGSGNEALVFAYTVQAGDMDANGIYMAADELELNGGTIQSAQGTDAELAYTQPGTQSGHKVDGVRPTPVLAATSDDGASIIILFSEPLHMTTAPASAFTLAVNPGTAPAVSSATATGNRVTLGLDSALTSDQVVAVTYADVTSGDDAVAVQDTAGNDAANFTTGEGSVPAVANAVGTGCSVADGCYLVLLRLEPDTQRPGRGRPVPPRVPLFNDTQRHRHRTSPITTPSSRTGPPQATPTSRPTAPLFGWSAAPPTWTPGTTRPPPTPPPTRAWRSTGSSATRLPNDYEDFYDRGLGRRGQRQGRVR